MAISTEQLNNMTNSLKGKLNETLREICNNSLEQNTADISIIRQRLINSIDNVMSKYGLHSDVRIVERYVDDIAVSEMRNIHNNSIRDNYQIFDRYNESIITRIAKSHQEQQNADMDISNELVSSNNRLQEWQQQAQNSINLDASFNDLFRSIVTNSNLSNNYEALEEVKKIISTEKQNAEQMIKNNVSNLVDQNRISTITNARSFQESLIQLELKSQEIVQNAVEQTRQKAEEDIIIEYVEVPQQPQLSPQTQELVVQAKDVLSSQQTNAEQQRTTQMLNNMSLEELEQYEKTGVIPQHLQAQNNPNLVSNVQPNIK